MAQACVFDWQESGHGGFSAIEMSADGTGALILTDRATWLSARFTRGADGCIRKVAITADGRLRDTQGTGLTGRARDSEGLAVAANKIFVSFEQVHRIHEYWNPDSLARILPSPDHFQHFPGNASFEALAVNSVGTLFTLPERAPSPRYGYPVFAFRNGQWRRAFRLPRGGGFRAVGADFDEIDRLYLLERRVGLRGFQTRLRRWQITGDQPRDETLLFLSKTGRFHNLEGISIWRNASGDRRATMIGDNNFLTLLRNEIVEITLPE